MESHTSLCWLVCCASTHSPLLIHWMCVYIWTVYKAAFSLYLLLWLEWSVFSFPCCLLLQRNFSFLLLLSMLLFKYLFYQGESHTALLTLQKGVADHYPATIGTNMDHNEKLSKAKAMLLVARLMEESSSFESNMVLKQFKEVGFCFPNSSASHVTLSSILHRLQNSCLKWRSRISTWQNITTS